MRVLPSVIAGAAGAVTAFFLDPQSGHRRRTQALDRSAGMARRIARMTARTGRGMNAEIEGQRRRMMHAVAGEPRPVASEETLADRVRSELFRDAEVPKGSLLINVERERVVVLRGEVKRPEMIRDLEGRVRAIPGVRDIENLLHTPGTPARMHT